jgi:hypothetical protein
MVIYEGGCYLLHGQEPEEKVAKKRTIADIGSGLEGPVKREKASSSSRSNAAAGAGGSEDENEYGY